MVKFPIAEMGRMLRELYPKLGVSDAVRISREVDLKILKAIEERQRQHKSLVNRDDEGINAKRFNAQ